MGIGTVEEKWHKDLKIWKVRDRNLEGELELYVGDRGEIWKASQIAELFSKVLFLPAHQNCYEEID